MITVTGSIEDVKTTLKLARDMSGYIHHSGYPCYDGGHTEPESECQHPDCKAVHSVELVLKQNG